MNNFIVFLFAISSTIFSCKTTDVGSKNNVNHENVETLEPDEYEIAIGETFEVKLSANPSTGYSWNWVNKESITVVNLSNSVYVKNEPTNDEVIMVGVGGNEKWTFVGVEAGEETIILEYTPSWARETVARTKKIIVKVK